jgi:hypothetical protein
VAVIVGRFCETPVAAGVYNGSARAALFALIELAHQFRFFVFKRFV